MKKLILKTALIVAVFAITFALVSCAPASDNAVSDEDKAISNEATDPLETYGGKVIDLEKIKKTNHDNPNHAIGHYYVGEDAETLDMPNVYFTKDISSEGLIAVYNALNWDPEGKVAVKISTGESNESNQLDPDLIKDLIHKVDGTIVECNTAYNGNRSNTEDHYKAAEEHGYTAIAKVDIMDGDAENNSISLPVGEKAECLSENLVGSHFANYDSFIVLSHFKGHRMAGFGGALKNASIGIASAPEGKCNIHSGGKSKTEWFHSEADPFQKSMAEATQAVSNSLDNGDNIIYISVMNRMSVDCDCLAKPRESDIHDVGILASTDPIALDQACIDLASCMDGSGALMLRIATRNGLLSLEHGENIGLGSRDYNLISIDK